MAVGKSLNTECHNRKKSPHIQTESASVCDCDLPLSFVLELPGL